MKRENEWLEDNGNYRDWDDLDMAELIQEVQGDALRSAAEDVHKNQSRVSGVDGAGI